MQNRIKSLAGDTAVYGALTIVGRFLTFLLYPLYTNVIENPVEIGEITYLLAFIAFVNILYSFGMETAFMRFYVKDDLTKSKTVFSHAYLFILLMSVSFSIVIYMNAGWFGQFVTSGSNASKLVKLALLIPLTDALMLVPYGLLRMQRKTIRFSYAKILLILFTLFFNYLFVIVYQWRVEGVLLAQVLANGIGVLILSKEIFSNLIFKFKRDYLVDMLKFGIPTIPASFSAIILQVADRPLVESLAGMAALGKYGVAYKLGIPMMLIVTAFDYAWKPFYLTNYNAIDAKKTFARIMTYYTLLGAIVFLGISLFIDHIVRIPFYDGTLIKYTFWDALGIVPFILGGYFFNGLYSNLAAGFNITKKTKYLPIPITIAAIVNISMNLALIPVLGYYGAAWATLVAYFVSAVILFLMSRKVYPINYEWKRIGLIVISVLIVYFISNEITKGLELYLAFGVRVLAFLIFILILRLTGFFTSKEITFFKKFFTRKLSLK